MKIPHITVNPLAAAGAAAPLDEQLLWKTLIFQNKNSNRLSHLLISVAAQRLTSANGRFVVANYGPNVTGVNSAFYIQLSLKLLKHAHKLWQDPSSECAHLSCQKSRQDKAEHHYSHALCHPLQSLNHSLASYLLLSTFPHYVLGQGILWIPQLLFLQQMQPWANGVICTVVFICFSNIKSHLKASKMSVWIQCFGGKRRQEVPIWSSHSTVSISAQTARLPILCLLTLLHEGPRHCEGAT